MIELQTYNLAGWVVEEGRQKERHADDPPRYPWGDSDIAFLERAYSVFQTSVTPKPEFDPSDPKFTEKMAVYAQELINDYQNVSAPSLPNLDQIKADYEQFLKRQQELVDLESKKKPKLAPTRIELIKRLESTLPNVDSLTVEFIANRTVLDITPGQWQQAVQQSAKDIQLLAEVTNTPVTLEATIVCLEASSSYLVEEIPEFSESLQTVAEISPELASNTTMAAALGFSDSVLTPSPRFESASTVALAPSAALVTSQALINKEVPVKQIFLQIEEVLKFHQHVAAEINKKLATSGLRDEDKQMAAEVIKYHILPPLVLASSYNKNQPEDKKAISVVEKVFAQIGLKQYLDSHGVATNTVRQTALVKFLESVSYGFVYYDAPSQVQSFYQHRASASPQMKGFFNDLWNFGTGQITDQIKNKAGEVVLDKFWATSAGQGLRSALGLGAKAAVTAGTEAAAGAAVGAEVGAAAGTAVAPGVGTIIGLVIGFIASKSKDILSWAKRNFRPIAVATGAAIGLLILGPVGAVLGAVGGFVVASPMVSLTTVANSVATGITSASTALVGLVATEIATPIIVIVLSVPIVIALFLFIINTSALVVPVNLIGSSGFGNVINPPMGPGGNYPTCWPTRGKITQGPSCSTGNSSHCSYRSNAVDIANKLGEPIYATHDGTAYPLVYPASADFGGWGIYVEVRSPLGFRTVYGHMSESIDKIMEVKSGTQIGAMGRTGWVIGIPGIHTHYELMSLAGGPPPFTMPPPNSPKIPKGLVPTYQLGGSTEGCFANESGGSADVVK